MPDAPRPALKHASVLTCVKTAPPAGSFRPAYTGPKRQHNFNDLRFDLLPQLAPPSGTPNMSTAERYVERVWLDHKPMWNGRYTHPSANMKDYGRDLSSEINDAILMLMLDVPAKERLLVRVVQVGIDLFGVIEDGAHFNYGGGHGIGRKWPIVFAGIMLDDTAMKNVGQSTSAGTFQEDCQTFFITQADKNKFPSIFKTVGEPGWGERHCTRATDDKSRGYRTCCTANAWHGAALGARIMGAVGVWNWPAFFDYTDGYMAEQLESPDAGRGHWMRSWSGFAEQMWDSHRSKF
jgi:hypothetical protein